MTPQPADIKLAQQLLNLHCRSQLKKDGVFGPLSVATAAAWIPWTFQQPASIDGWVAAVIQKSAIIRGVYAGANDAFWGPQTADAAQRINAILNGQPVTPVARPDEQTIAHPDKASRCWSPSTSAFEAHYGPVGENQVMVASPYPLRLDWDLATHTSRFSAHRLVAPQIEAAMAEILSVYGPAAIQRLGLDRFGGCLNVRLKRGGTTQSVHSWGAAIDWYPDKNQLRQHKDTALFATDPYVKFMDIWLSHGFMSLGRCYDFDWMHVQMNP